jgi:hypothetical protein
MGFLFYIAIEATLYASPHGNMRYLFRIIFNDVKIVQRSVEIGELEMGKLTQMLLDSLVE